MSGNMFLAIGAMIILTLLTMTINSSILSSADVSQNSEFTITGNGVIQSIIEEIRSKSYDLATANNPDAKVGSFTAPGSLGPAYNESYPNFNDVDDFHNCNINISTPRAGHYNVLCVVVYVDPDYPDTQLNHVSHAKRVSVTVTSPFMKDTLRAVHVASF